MRFQNLAYALAIGAVLNCQLTSCSSQLCRGKGVATTAHVELKHPDQPWYQCFLDEHGQRMFITLVPVTYEFQHELGYWRASNAENKKACMQASGKKFRIESGYVWDGATEGPTTAKLLTPTLFHDAMLHAMINGAPISQDQADGAFLQLMRKEKFLWSKPYYKIVRNFGGAYLEPQNPRTLIITLTR